MITLTRAGVAWLKAQYMQEFNKYLEEIGGIENLPRMGKFRTQFQLEESIGALQVLEETTIKYWFPHKQNQRQDAPIAIMDYCHILRGRMKDFYNSAKSVLRIGNKKRHCRVNMVYDHIRDKWNFFQLKKRGWYTSPEKSWSGKAEWAYSTYFINSNANELMSQICNSPPDRYYLENMKFGVRFQRMYSHPARPGKLYSTKLEAIADLEGYYDPTNKAKNADKVRKTVNFNNVVLKFGLDDVREEIIKNPVTEITDLGEPAPLEISAIPEEDENDTENQVKTRKRWWEEAEPVISIRVPVDRNRILIALTKRAAEVEKQNAIRTKKGQPPRQSDLMMNGLEKMLYDLDSSEDNRVTFNYYRDKHGRDYETNYWVQTFSSEIRKLLFPDSISMDLKSGTPSCLYWLVKEENLDESEFKTLAEIFEDPDKFRTELAETILTGNSVLDENAKTLAKAAINIVSCGGRCDPKGVLKDYLCNKWWPKLSIRKFSKELGYYSKGYFGVDELLVQHPKFKNYVKEIKEITKHVKNTKIDKNKVQTNSAGLSMQLEKKKNGTIISHEYQGREARIRDAVYNYPFPTENGTVPLKDVPGAITCVIHDGVYISKWAMDVIKKSGLALDEHVKNVTGINFKFTFEDNEDNELEKEYQKWLKNSDIKSKWEEKYNSYIEEIRTKYGVIQAAS